PTFRLPAPRLEAQAKVVFVDGSALSVGNSWTGEPGVRGVLKERVERDPRSECAGSLGGQGG
ncbi:hypothetical protein, partial [Solirubrobacter deserti]